MNASITQNAPTDATLLTTSLTLTGEYWSNLHGGTATGSRWFGLAYLCTEFDLARTGGPEASKIIAELYALRNQRKDSTLASLTGAYNTASGWDAGDMLRVGNLHYRQTWQDEALVLKVGQLGIDDDFIGSEHVCVFANSAFGTTPAQIGTPLSSGTNNAYAFTGYAVYAPGVFFSADVNKFFSWQAGAYYGGPGTDEKENHGFEWESASTSGVALFAETSWRFRLAGHASTLRFGAAYHTGQFDNFAALLAGEEPSTVHGLYSFYIGHDLTLSADSKGAPWLAAFWRAGTSPQQDRSVVGNYVDAGFKWFGPFAARPDDHAGIAISWTQFGRDFRALSGVDVLASHETTLELTYRAQLTSHWALQADVQLLRNTSDPSAAGKHAAATVVGLRTELTF